MQICKNPKSNNHEFMIIDKIKCLSTSTVYCTYEYTVLYTVQYTLRRIAYIGTQGEETCPQPHITSTLSGVEVSKAL